MGQDALGEDEECVDGNLLKGSAYKGLVLQKLVTDARWSSYALLQSLHECSTDTRKRSQKWQMGLWWQKIGQSPDISKISD